MPVVKDRADTRCVNAGEDDSHTQGCCCRYLKGLGMTSAMAATSFCVRSPGQCVVMPIYLH